MALIRTSGGAAINKKVFAFDLHQQGSGQYGIGAYCFKGNDLVDMKGTTSSNTPSVTIEGVTVGGSASGQSYIYSITGFTGTAKYFTDATTITSQTISDPSTPTTISINVYQASPNLVLLSD